MTFLDDRAKSGLVTPPRPGVRAPACRDHQQQSPRPEAHHRSACRSRARHLVQRRRRTGSAPKPSAPAATALRSPRLPLFAPRLSHFAPDTVRKHSPLDLVAGARESGRLHNVLRSANTGDRSWPQPKSVDSAPSPNHSGRVAPDAKSSLRFRPKLRNRSGFERGVAPPLAKPILGAQRRTRISRELT
jgi:hypothetical protein